MVLLKEKGLEMEENDNFIIIYNPKQSNYFKHVQSFYVLHAHFYPKNTPSDPYFYPLQALKKEASALNVKPSINKKSTITITIYHNHNHYHFSSVQSTYTPFSSHFQTYSHREYLLFFRHEEYGRVILHSKKAPLKVTSGKAPLFQAYPKL